MVAEQGIVMTIDALLLDAGLFILLDVLGVFLLSMSIHRLFTVSDIIFISW